MFLIWRAVNGDQTCLLELIEVGMYRATRPVLRIGILDDLYLAPWTLAGIDSTVMHYPVKRDGGQCDEGTGKQPDNVGQRMRFLQQDKPPEPTKKTPAKQDQYGMPQDMERPGQGWSLGTHRSALEDAPGAQAESGQPSQ